MEPLGRILVFAIYRTNSDLLHKALRDFEGHNLTHYFSTMTTADQVYKFENHTFTTIDKVKTGATCMTLFGKTGEARLLDQYRITHDFMIHNFARMASTLYPDQPTQAEQVKKYLIAKFQDKDITHQDLLRALKTQYPECSAYNGRVITAGSSEKMQRFFDKLLNKKEKSFKTVQEKQAAREKKYKEEFDEAIRSYKDKSRRHREDVTAFVDKFIEDCRSIFSGNYTFLLAACKRIDELFADKSELKGVFVKFAEDLNPEKKRGDKLPEDADTLFKAMAEYHESVTKALAQIAIWNDKSEQLVDFLSLCADYLDKCFEPRYAIFTLAQECNKQVRDIEVKGRLEHANLDSYYPIVPELVKAFKDAVPTKPVAPPSPGPSLIDPAPRKPPEKPLPPPPVPPQSRALPPPGEADATTQDVAQTQQTDSIQPAPQATLNRTPTEATPPETVRQPVAPTHTPQAAPLAQVSERAAQVPAAANNTPSDAPTAVPPPASYALPKQPSERAAPEQTAPHNMPSLPSGAAPLPAYQSPLAKPPVDTATQVSPTADRALNAGAGHVAPLPAPTPAPQDALAKQASDNAAHSVAQGRALSNHAPQQSSAPAAHPPARPVSPARQATGKGALPSVAPTTASNRANSPLPQPRVIPAKPAALSPALSYTDPNHPLAFRSNTLKPTGAKLELDRVVKVPSNQVAPAPAITPQQILKIDAPAAPAAPAVQVPPNTPPAAVLPPTTNAPKVTPTPIAGPVGEAGNVPHAAPQAQPTPAAPSIPPEDPTSIGFFGFVLSPIFWLGRVLKSFYNKLLARIRIKRNK
ncbi:MAG: hypothetical protein LLG04_13470 [Parachlamydia sp.]|nr:hypothetical protein [Parachlamydia sp.]